MATNEGDKFMPESLKFEQEVLLAEYSAHRESIFKWQSYSNQAVGGYLAVLSILATILAKSDNKLLDNVSQLAPIVLIYVSLALLYVYLQFTFMRVSHIRYVEQNLIPRIRDLCPKRTEFKKPLLDWERFHSEYRRDTLKRTCGLFKFGVEAIPYLVVVITWLWYICRFLCEHLNNLRSVLPTEPCLTSLAYLFFGAILPPCLLIWVFSSNRKVSNDLRQAAKSE